MNTMDNLISLKGGDTYITNSEVNAYKVTEGTVLVYVVPMKNRKPGRRSFIYQAECNEVIPSFAYKDIEYCEWRFCFVAVDSAKLSVIENGSTRVLREKFSKKAKIKNFSREGFNGGLVDQYRINIVTEDGFIKRTQHQREDTASNILNLILNSFRNMKFNVSEGNSHNLLYNAMSILCNSQKIPIAPYEKIKEACGDKFDVPDVARISHFAYREIVLNPGWHKEDGGCFITFTEQKKPVVCLTKGTHSYMLWDVENNCALPCSKKVVESLSPKAYMIYTPLPNKKLNWKDLFGYCAKKIRTADIALLSFLTIVTSLIGILTPSLSQSIYDNYIPLGAKSVLFQLGCLLGSFMVANIMFSIVKNIATFRISSRMSYDMQSAVYDRLFNLPESFFRNYESADLAQRVMGADNVVASLANVLLSSAVALIFAVVYFVKMAGYSWKLTLIGLLLIVVYGFVYYFISARALKYKTKAIELDGKTGSLMYQFLTGIAKIRIAGVEDRALFEYLKPYVEQRNEEQKREKIQDLGAVINLVSGSLFSIVFYLIIIKAQTDISLGSFVAFNTLFGSFSAYVLQLVNSFVTYKNEKPNIDRLKPVFDALPEFDEANELPGDISGGIEINNVSFSYDNDSPLVLDNITLDIKPGEYVGLVGSSGCGKSTLMKLLLGFEKPNAGKIYYDNKDIESIDKRELRKKMGVVLQDGKLISGSIFENITITAPAATVKDVNAVIAAVGLKEDIAAMPMGLHTVLSEDCGTISGGQQQRILIARAIISNPKILFFDEATSALDNITQSMVCETLEKMDATRIVIAHRLSTIIKCDRIIVLDKGHIVEQGTYDELMQNRALFYQLASRQMV
ncbi:MAG: NHLP bacteriocin export ABC transporter permease/ATPase subunit [Ruminococcaceae bacterium]|nr:NHLP bacteriocin export ABC transporter permease/ATPase subunit [Oscillospiraceae bacterium]